MTIELITPEEHKTLKDIFNNYPKLTFQNNGFEYINKSEFTEEEKKFVLDSRKLDVEVTKTDEGTVVKVEAQTPVLKKVGKWVAHMMSKKFNRLKK